MQATAAAITSTGGQALACAADIPSETAVQAILEQTAIAPDDIVPLALFLATQPGCGPTAQSFRLMRRDG